MNVVIVGAGEMGYNLARRLSAEKQEVTVIDLNQERVNLIEEYLDVKAVTGRGSSPATLRASGVESAEILVAVTDSDEVNFMACYVAGHLKPGIKRVARIRDEDFSQTPEILDSDHLGLDLVISPETEAVKKLLEILQVPSATDVLDFAEGRIKLFGVQLLHGSPLVGKSLIQLRSEFPEKRILIPLIFRDANVIIPRGKDVLRSTDMIYVMSSGDYIPEILKSAGLKSEPIKSCMINGATVAGIRVASELEKRKTHNIRLIDPDPIACDNAASILDHTMVLRADPMDESFLRSEGISEMETFLSMTDHDEHNAFTALLAKRLGAGRVAALTNRMEYHRLISAIGVDVVVNPRVAGASRIVQHLRKGKVISVSTLPGEGVEAIEFEALHDSPVVDKELSRIRFPNGAILAAVEREKDFFIPHGATVVRPGDRVIVFAKRESIPKVENLFGEATGER
jgi:trk system potassium uptake protein TrkA